MQVFEAWRGSDYGSQYRGLWVSEDDAMTAARGTLDLSAIRDTLVSQAPERLSALEDGEVDVHPRDVVALTASGFTPSWAADKALIDTIDTRGCDYDIVAIVSEVLSGDQSVLCVNPDAVIRQILSTNGNATHLAVLPSDGRNLAADEYCVMQRYVMSLALVSR